MPYPADPAFNTLVAELEQHCDHVLVLISELHDKTVEFITSNDRSKLAYFICGDLNFEVEHCTIHKFYDWFTTTVHFYRNVRPETLDVLQPYNTKPKFFDALLGRKKYHRDFAYRHLNQDLHLVTYLGSKSNFDNDQQWRWESTGLDITNMPEWTVERYSYYGHRMSLSQVIPLEVYNETAYTLVAETNFSNHYSFYTEKTIKPIIARRLFVMLGGQYQLQNLHSLGFKTFSEIIDESYDLIEPVDRRFNMAMDQIKYLETQPQEEILAKIKPICDHNYNVMMTTDWYEDYFKLDFVRYFNQ